MAAESMSFEESIKRLEEIVSIMEKGDSGLEESLKLFHEGTALIRECSAVLDQAEMQVKMITVAEDGSPREETFNDGQ